MTVVYKKNYLSYTGTGKKPLSGSVSGLDQASAKCLDSDQNQLGFIDSGSETLPGYEGQIRDPNPH